MNTQPYETPPQWWAPAMKPWWVKLSGHGRRRDIRNQKITQLTFEGTDRVRELLAQNTGILVTPNHSFHYDSYCLIEASEQVGRPFHFLTAWQVFAGTHWLGKKSLQWHGCFSINREGNDIAAFKQAVELLQESPYPLAIFPEGDIYHTNERVTPFRDGAAAIALAAARKAKRPIVCVPTCLKQTYTTDPTPELEAMMTRLEQRLYWRPLTGRPLPERLYRFAEGMLSLKELEYRGATQKGSVSERTGSLMEHVLQRLEATHQVTRPADGIPERAKELRRRIIRDLEAAETTADRRPQLGKDLEDVFLVIQLYSYPGDYVAERPSIERIAETIDKFEEDVLRADCPTPRGTRHVTVRFGEPIPVPQEKAQQPTAEKLTDTLQKEVQTLLNTGRENAAIPVSGASYRPGAALINTASVP